MRFYLLLFLMSSAAICYGQELSPDRVYPTFAVGPSGIYVSIEKQLQVTVKSIMAGSPAAKTNLTAGDILVSAGGRSLAVADPRVPLGESVGEAESNDGKWGLTVSRGGSIHKVTVALPVLGGYGNDWPEDCRKSASIIRQTAEYIIKSQDDSGAYQFESGRPFRDNLQGCLASLFLLSTGDDSYLLNVKLHVQQLSLLAETRKNAGGHVNWQLGYQGILLSEYFLRTGDRQVLPGLQELCDWCVDNQAAGGWGHGAGVGPGYVQSGLMNHAGLPIVITLILSQECGLKIDPQAYANAVKLMYRMAGHGCIAYGDHRSELWWSNTNGRNAMLSCAFSLLSDVPQYRAASRHLALLVTDSYYQPEFGHTGGGFNVIWRGLASVHVPEDRRDHYRRQMKSLAWYYDLCRQPGGGFSILPTPPDNSRYSGLEWGTGAIGLTYTAPLAKLRITGAPRTTLSVRATEPAFRWGNESDLQFLSTDDAEGFGRESSEPSEVYRLLLKDRKQEATVEFCAKHLRHYSPLVRTWAARRLGEMNDSAAITALTEASKHHDARVRRAAFDAISGYDNWSRPIKGRIDPSVVSEKFLTAILKTLNDPDSAWWEIDGALFALGQARPEDIRKELPLLEKFTRHDDWYLREAAFWGIVGLHRTISGEEFQLLSHVYAQSKHVFERASFDSGFRTILKNDKVAFDRATMVASIKQLGQTTHRPGVMLGYGTGGVHEAAHRTMMILKHFDPDVYSLMIGDFVIYLENWEPYYQHSVWLIKGSNWQPGILKVLQTLGPEGRPIIEQLRKIDQRYDGFDQARIPRDGSTLRDIISAAIRGWDEQHRDSTN